MGLRTRKIIAIPVVRFQATGHVYAARTARWSERALRLREPVKDFTRPKAGRARLRRRTESIIKALFVFVVGPEAPPGNSAAEGSLIW